jgi:hypothetical protein
MEGDSSADAKGRWRNGSKLNCWNSRTNDEEPSYFNAATINNEPSANIEL